MKSNQNKYKLWLCKVLFLFCGLLIGNRSIGANQPVKSGKDTILVMQLIQKAKESLNQSFDSVCIYAKEAIKISEKTGFTKGIAWGYHRIGQAFDFAGASDSALKYCNISQNYFRLINDSVGIAHNLYTFGNIYFYKTWYDAALKYYFDAYKIYQRIKYNPGINDCYAGIGFVYESTNNWSKSIYYLMLTAKYERDTKNELGLAETYGDIGEIYYKLGKRDSLLYYYTLAAKIATETNNIRVLSFINTNLGLLARDDKNYSSAIQHLTKSIELKNKIHFNERLGENYIDLGTVYIKTGNFQKALQCIHKGIELSKQFNASDDIATGYMVLSDYYSKTGDTKKSFEAYKTYRELNDTVISKKYNEQVAQWQTLYELKKNEFQLAGAKNQLTLNHITIQKNKVFQQFLLALVTILILFSLLVYRSIRIKHIIVEKENEIQKHKIRELEKEKILLATQSILQGEEIERKRLARDLHDGLGGLLSGAKIAFNNMKGNVILPHDNVNDFNQALIMLDTSISELRRVAHNMMPEALMKLGLKDALADFCAELDKCNPLHIIFQFYGQFKRLESNLEINAYRIIQELINNAIKHSGATELVVQMMQEPNRLCLMVMDNGIGFDFTKLDTSKGVGFSSVKSRVDAFNGDMGINSNPGKGTEFTIEFKV